MNENVKAYYFELLKGYSVAQDLYQRFNMVDFCEFWDSKILEFHEEFLKHNSLKELKELQRELALELALQGYSLNKETFLEIKGGEQNEQN